MVDIFGYPWYCLVMDNNHTNTVGALPLGTYTAVGQTGRATVKIVSDPTFANGRKVAKLMVGPDNERSFRGVGWVTEHGIKPWPRVAANFPKDVRIVEWSLRVAADNTQDAKDAFLEMTEAYALVSSKCFNCGHKLTVPVSIYRGLGPVCAKGEGLA